MANVTKFVVVACNKYHDKEEAHYIKLLVHFDDEDVVECYPSPELCKMILRNNVVDVVLAYHPCDR